VAAVVPAVEDRKGGGGGGEEEEEEEADPRSPGGDTAGSPGSRRDPLSRPRLPLLTRVPPRSSSPSPSRPRSPRAKLMKRRWEGGGRRARAWISYY